MNVLLEEAAKAHAETDQTIKQGQDEVAQEVIINKKIHDEIKDTNNTNADRINRLRVLLARKAALERIEQNNNNTH